MAKECIYNCPRIKAILYQMQANNMWSGPSSIHADALADIFGQASTADELLKAVEQTYDCPGPRLVIENKLVGRFVKRTVPVETWVCGLKEKA